MSVNLKGLYIKDKSIKYVVNDSISIESLSILTPEYIQEHIKDFVDNDRLVVNHLIYYKVNNKLTNGDNEYVLLSTMLPFISKANEEGKLVYININTDGNGSYIIIDQDSFEYESGEFESGTKVIPNVPLDGTEEPLTSLQVDDTKFAVPTKTSQLDNDSGFITDTSGTYEEWTFTLADNTTVTKNVKVK